MEVHITQACAPHIPEEILFELNAMSPKVFMEWNPRVRLEINHTSWRGRWEIWCELRDSHHPDATNILYRTDRWNTDAQCWMRKLQVYQTEGGDFAPADEALIIGLNLVDVWADRLFYQNNIVDPHTRDEIRRTLMASNAASGGASYYRNFNNPTVGAHSGKHARSDWRWRQR